MESSHRQVIAGLMARVLAVLAVLILLGFGTAAAIQHHRADAPAQLTGDAEYRMLGDRLREVRELMLGTSLPPGVAYCQASASTTLHRLGLPIPQLGSRGWQIMVDHCANSAR